MFLHCSFRWKERRGAFKGEKLTNYRLKKEVDEYPAHLYLLLFYLISFPFFFFFFEISSIDREIDGVMAALCSTENNKCTLKFSISQKYYALNDSLTQPELSMSELSAYNQISIKINREIVYRNGLIYWSRLDHVVKDLEVPKLTSRDLLVYALLCFSMLFS